MKRTIRVEEFSLQKAAGGGSILDAHFQRGQSVNLALTDQLLDSSGHVLNRNRGGDPVLVEQVDDFYIESLERCFCDCSDMIGSAAQVRLRTIGVNQKSELGGNHHPVADRCERFPDKNLVRLSPVALGGVKERGPRSTFDRISETISLSSAAGPYPKLMPKNDLPLRPERGGVWFCGLECTIRCSVSLYSRKYVSIFNTIHRKNSKSGHHSNHSPFR